MEHFEEIGHFTQVCHAKSPVIGELPSQIHKPHGNVAWWKWEPVACLA